MALIPNAVSDQPWFMRKRSIAIKGHRTSISLEPAFWEALDRIAARQGLSLPSLVAEIDRRRLLESPPSGLASSLRVFALREVSSGVGDKA